MALIMLAEPSSVGDDKFFKKDAPVKLAFRHCLKHFCDAYWEPLWAAYQELGIAIHRHGDGGLKTPLSRWRGFSAYELFAVTSPAAHSSLDEFRNLDLKPRSKVAAINSARLYRLR